MLRIATIVEGKGEVEAVPILLRRIGHRLRPDLTLDLPRPIRVPRQRIIKPGELEQARPDIRNKVVLAKSEFESWFLAAARSVAGRREIDEGTTPPNDPESIRDAKGWLSARMPPGRSYRPTLDQAALSARIDLDAARTAPSFDKLWRDVEFLLMD